MVGYFIWSGIRARKLNQKVKDNTLSITQNERYCQDADDSLSESIDEVNIRVDNNVNELSERIHSMYGQNSDNRDELDRKIHKELDKRFDKVWQTIQNNSLFQKYNIITASGNIDSDKVTKLAIENDGEAVKDEEIK